MEGAHNQQQQLRVIKDPFSHGLLHFTSLLILIDTHSKCLSIITFCLLIKPISEATGGTPSLISNQTGQFSSTHI